MCGGFLRLLDSHRASPLAEYIEDTLNAMENELRKVRRELEEARELEEKETRRRERERWVGRRSDCRGAWRCQACCFVRKR